MNQQDLIPGALSLSSKALRDRPHQSEERRDVIAEDAVLLRCAEESAVAAHVIEALLVRAEALHIGHVGAPDELPGAETIAHATDQLLRLRVGVVPDAAPGNREHDFEEQIVAAIDFERLVRDLPFPAAREIPAGGPITQTKGCAGWRFR